MLGTKNVRKERKEFSRKFDKIGLLNPMGFGSPDKPGFDRVFFRLYSGTQNRPD